MAKKQPFFSLKNVRKALAIFVFGALTFFFVDFNQTVSTKWHILGHIQLVPAILAGSFGILAVLILLTFLFGRIYCSVICPMGILQDIIAWVSKKFNKKKKYSYSKSKNILRWSVLGVFIISLLFSLTFLALFAENLEPYSIFGRIATHIFRPIYFEINNLFEKIFTSFGYYTFYKINIVFNLHSFLIAIISFLLIGFFAWKHGRTFCNTICPTGTILSFVSKYSLFKIKIDEQKCTHCGVCDTKCKAACINSKEQKIDYSRCVDCFNCLNVCKQKALKYSPSFKQPPLVPPKGGDTPLPIGEGLGEGLVDKSKRKFLATSLLTILSIPALLAQGKEVILKNGLKIFTRKTPISPPGSQSHKNLLKKCTSCHLCISKCPSKVLKPAFMEYGIAGMMQPIMSFENGYCNYNCTVCSAVCPNGALSRLTKRQKHETQVGKVVFNRDICFVVKNGYNCGACSEHCPTQAVKMVPYKDGLTIPEINTDLCIGCGGCEYICPVRPYPAIFVEGNEVHQTAKIENNEEDKSIKINDFGF